VSDIAITCAGVWKSYRIYHQRAHTLKERILARGHRYEDFWALKGVDLEVPAGTTVGVIGPNGSGKSTLLKTMARILTPNRGRVTVNGTVSPLLEIGTGFHPDLTGRENVFLGGTLLGESRRAVERRYDDIVAFAGIEPFMDIPVKNYSSGMYARLAFAVAISVDPEILIVDEVLSVGDEEFQLRCYERIAELRAQGRTIVLVSHSLPTIRTMCTTAVWIDAGTVRAVGRAADVVADYLADVHHETSSPQAPGPSGRRYGSGEAEVLDISVRDEQGAVAEAFVTGDPMTIRVVYRLNREVESAVCSIGVLRSENLAYVFGQNSAQAGVALEPSGEGIVELTVPRLPLLTGHYLLTVALHDEAANLMYDCHDRRHSFSVAADPALPIEGGIVHVAAEWKARPAPVPVR
jgi:ABC-2 type transport system ATP-binding protein